MGIAIILYMGLPGLGVARSLGREGVEVFGIDCIENALGFKSRYCRKAFVFPNPETSPVECLGEFIKLGKGLEEKAVLIPTADYWVDFISRFRDELSEHFLFNIPSASTLETLVDKSKQYSVARDLGIPIPTTFSPESMDQLMEVGEAISYPVFIKGVVSHLWYDQFENKGFRADSFAELQKYFQLAQSRNVRVVIQEIIVGPNKNHFKVSAYYSRDRKLLALFSTQKTRQFPADFGIGSLMISMKVPELIVMALKFFEGLGYTGVGSIEFKQDERDGTFKLLELNPRFWRQNIQATHAGVNFPYINYLDCLGVEVPPTLTFKENVRYLNAFEDFLSFRQNWRRGDVSFWEWLRSILHVDCYAYLAWDDLRPLWTSSVDSVKMLSRKPFARLSCGQRGNREESDH